MSTMTQTRQLAALLGFISLFPFRADGSVFVPPGLVPGDMYHLAFVTRDRRDATSFQIADYNAFVQAQAALNPSLTGTDMGVKWHAIASTPDDAARDNARVEAPVYRLDGVKIADGFDDIWNGSLDASLSVTQFVLLSEFLRTWTGTLSNGTKLNDRALGVGGGMPFTGVITATTPPWVSSDVDNPASLHAFYALSDKRTVPRASAVIPEQASAIIWSLLIGIATLACEGSAARWRRSAAEPA
jgi:hypothetical protein